MKLILRTSRCFSINLSNYSVLEKDVNALKSQLLFRSENLGVRELDLIVGTWAKHNLLNYS
jgi:succinate dehydrogenase flavin-adding protein (antitoxin of CptAB toxin-antitoxin module)